MTTTAITRINALLQQLLTQAQQLDQRNSLSPSEKMRRKDNLFSTNLFRSESHQYVPYVQETMHAVSELQNLLSRQQHDYAALRLTQIEQQTSALVNALNANESLQHEAQYRIAANKRRATIRHKQATQRLVEPSQNLYQKLAEHHEFERRLNAMLQERELARSNATAKNSERLSQEVLKLHQRLGRCRQAISQIERDIERMEKRQ